MSKAAGRQNTPIDRQPMRSEARPPDGRAVAIGRDGKPVWRRITQADNVYNDIGRYAPDGWVYQWRTNTIHNQPQTTALAADAMNGWTPVPHKRHPGLFSTPGTMDEQPIIVGSSILCECPVTLVAEAEEERQIAARAPVRTVRDTQNATAGWNTGATTTATASVRQASFARERVERLEIDPPKYPSNEIE
jgi:hypothetical protein